jgi:hypothetical protein
MQIDDGREFEVPYLPTMQLITVSIGQGNQLTAA